MGILGHAVINGYASQERIVYWWNAAIVGIFFYHCIHVCAFNYQCIQASVYSSLDSYILYRVGISKTEIN